MTERHREFLDGMPKVKTEAWAVVRKVDKVGGLELIKLTHHQFHQNYYGWIKGEVMEAAHRTVRAQHIVERFAARKDAEAAMERGWLAWEGQHAAMEKARKELRTREKSRETALWNAVKGI